MGGISINGADAERATRSIEQRLGRACACLCLACVKGVGLHCNSRLRKGATFSLFGPVKTGHLPLPSVPFAHALSDAVQRHIRVCLRVAPVTGHAVSDRLGLA